MVRLSCARVVRWAFAFVALVHPFHAATARALPYTRATVPSEYTVVQEAPPGNIAVGRSQLAHLQFNPDGTGRLLEVTPTADPSMVWTLDRQGGLTVTPLAPAQFAQDYFSDSTACTGGRFIATYALAKIMLRRRTTSARGDVVVATVETTARYARTPESGDCPTPAAQTSRYAITQRGLGVQQQVPFTAADLANPLTLTHAIEPSPVPTLSGSNTSWSTALFDFRSRTIAFGSGISETFDYTLDTGRLRIVAADPQGARVAYEYRRLQLDRRGGDGILTIATRPDGRISANYQYAVQAQSGASFGNLLAAWHSAFRESGYQPDIRFSFTFTALPTTASTGRAVLTQTVRDPVTDQRIERERFYSVSIDGSTLTLKRYRTTGGLDVPECSSGQTCWLYEARRWQLLSRVTGRDTPQSPLYERLNVLESIDQGNPEDDQIERIDQRTNYYQH